MPTELDAREGFDGRQKIRWVEGGPVDPRDAEIARLRAQVAALQAQQPSFWSLQWPKALHPNYMTCFPTREKASAYAEGCGDDKPSPVPMYTAPPALRERLGQAPGGDGDA